MSSITPTITAIIRFTSLPLSVDLRQPSFDLLLEVPHVTTQVLATVEEPLAPTTYEMITPSLAWEPDYNVRRTPRLGLRRIEEGHPLAEVNRMHVSIRKVNPFLDDLASL
jgi:hypothetical protein